MGGLGAKRLRLQGRIEGNLVKLRRTACHDARVSAKSAKSKVRAAGCSSTPSWSCGGPRPRRPRGDAVGGGGGRRARGRRDPDPDPDNHHVFLHELHPIRRDPALFCSRRRRRRRRGAPGICSSSSKAAVCWYVSGIPPSPSCAFSSIIEAYDKLQNDLVTAKERLTNILQSKDRKLATRERPRRMRST